MRMARTISTCNTLLVGWSVNLKSVCRLNTESGSVITDTAITLSSAIPQIWSLMNSYTSDFLVYLVDWAQLHQSYSIFLSANARENVPFCKCQGLITNSVNQSAHLLLWSKLKYHDSYWTGCNEILYRHSWSPEDECWWTWWSPDFLHHAASRLTFSGTEWNVFTTFGWIAKTTGKTILGPQKNNCNNL